MTSSDRGFFNTEEEWSNAPKADGIPEITELDILPPEIIKLVRREYYTFNKRRKTSIPTPDQVIVQNCKALWKNYYNPEYTQPGGKAKT